MALPCSAAASACSVCWVGCAAWRPWAGAGACSATGVTVWAAGATWGAAGASTGVTSATGAACTTAGASTGVTSATGAACTTAGWTGALAGSAFLAGAFSAFSALSALAAGSAETVFSEAGASDTAAAGACSSDAFCVACTDTVVARARPEKAATAATVRALPANRPLAD